MKRFIAITISVILVTGLVGCGTPMYEITEEEGDLIATYCGNAVAKFNRFQDDGIAFVINKTTAAQNEYLGISYAEEEEKAPEEEETFVADDESVGDSTAGQFSERFEITSVPIGELLGYPDLNISCNDIHVASEYQEGSYILLTPSEGFEYLVIGISIQNPGNENISCDFLAKEPHFVATFPDGNEFATQGTILLEDFYTFQENIEAGSTSRSVALMEIPSSYGSDLSGMSLVLVCGGSATGLPINL